MTRGNECSFLSCVFLPLMFYGPVVVGGSAWMTLPKIPFQGSTAEAAQKDRACPDFNAFIKK